MKPVFDFMADFILEDQIPCVQSRYTAFQIELKFSLELLINLCIFLSIFELKSQTWYNPKQLHLRCSKFSGSASVKCIVTLNLYECKIERLLRYG